MKKILNIIFSSFLELTTSSDEESELRSNTIFFGVVGVLCVRDLLNWIHIYEIPFCVSTLIGIAIFLLSSKRHPSLYKWYTFSQLLLLPFLMCHDPRTSLLVLQLCPYLAASYLMTTRDIKSYLGLTVLLIVIIQYLGYGALRKMISEYNTEEVALYFMELNIKCFILSTTAYSLTFRNLQKANAKHLLSQKKTGQANTHLQEFVYGFSHELRNPLNSLFGSLSLALTEDNPQEVKKMISTAEICAQLLLQLVNNTLDTGKADMGKLEVIYTDTHIRDLLRKVWTIYNQLISGKGIIFSCKAHKQIPRIITTDPFRLNQLLMNLIGNANKFTAHGHIDLSVEWLKNETIIDESHFMPYPYCHNKEDLLEEEGGFERQRNFSSLEKQSDFINASICKPLSSSSSLNQQESVEESGILRIIIRDSGIGIPEDKLKQLFGKFSQFSPSSHSQMGTGLGLFITKEIVKKMAGQIQVFSKVNSGTTVVVCIPCISPAVQDMPTMEEGLIYLKSKKLKAIMIDGVSLNVSIFSRFLQKICCETVGTSLDAEEGFQKWRQSTEHVDIILCDMEMPVMNGLQLTEKIREYEKTFKMQPALIALIGTHEYENLPLNSANTWGKRDFADLFFKKPVAFEDLTMKIHQTIKFHVQSSISIS